jgi:serine protease Do
MNEDERIYTLVIPNRKEKKRKPMVKVVAVLLFCMALMLGGGLAGAKLTLNHLNVAVDSNDTTQNYASADSTVTVDSVSAINDNSGGSGTVNLLGSVNSGGGELSLPELFVGANPAVVAISTETTGRNMFGQTVNVPSAGSGFIISEDGYIVTNNHVIENASTISVLLHDGTKCPASLVGRDPSSDLAVLKIEKKGLSYLTWGNSGSLQVGEQVAAIGNPLGEFSNSMTVGYISGLNRELNIDGIPRKMLQTDASVNAGNSGGPLLNMKGQVIGIVTAKSRGSDVEGMGFAIPSNAAAGIIDRLMKDGYVPGRAVMGVTVGIMKDDDGWDWVYIESVNSGSAAEKAGIKKGDIILSANGKELSTTTELSDIIGELSPGDNLALRILRGEKEMSVTVKLDEYKPNNTANQAPSGGQYPDSPSDGGFNLPDGTLIPFDFDFWIVP